MLLAAEIPQDLREYTVHDAAHLDALWELADVIGGDLIELTPTEAYVLGGAFLIHDLGMGLAAWPGGIDSLKKEYDWRDIVAACTMELRGRPAADGELDAPAADVEQAAKEIALREKHASHAAELALISWTSTATAEEYHLIDDVDLRTTYGHLIGQIAASHWWDIEKISATFPAHPIGAPVNCPSEWTVDSLKLACLLRLADAAHLDSRRAPKFLRAVRNPRGLSDIHWSFQGHLQQIRRQDDQLLFTAAQPFEVSEISAWWACHDALHVVDKELRSVDALLVEMSRPRMAARAVKGVDSPSRLSTLIPTRGWIPVDASITVSNVPSLVKKLGGESLYGNRPDTAIRELIQNAADATRALATLTDAAPAAITVAYETDEQGADWIRVTDSGVGMSRAVMTGVLLDFGRSYWGSQLMREESPGLAASKFRPAGRYGIGFYAAFMIGDYVSVVSRRYDEASSDTRILEFPEGLAGRPILRIATRQEMRHSGGTTVSIKLRDPDSYDLLMDDKPRVFAGLNYANFFDLCQKLAPSLDVPLQVIDRGEERRNCIESHDWKTLTGRELICRLGHVGSPIWSSTHVSLGFVSDAMRPIMRGDRMLAHAALAPVPPGVIGDQGEELRVWGVITGGGLRIAELGGAIGIFTGQPLKADRTKASLDASAKEIADWASEQAEIWQDEINSHSPEWNIYVALLSRLGADTKGVHIACTAEGYLSAHELEEWARDRRRIVIADDFDVEVDDKLGEQTFWSRSAREYVLLGEDIVLAPSSNAQYGEWDAWPGEEYTGIRRIPVRSGIVTSPEEWWKEYRGSTVGLVIHAIARAWNCAPESIVRSLSNIDENGRRLTLDIGKSVVGAKPVSSFVEFLIDRDLIP
ncbi:hypothetical protein Abr02nite_38710 [Paractinoplanes brasiliensis]|nr:hypothetical protein Abr02nite_38710 [Actinoplanes brasiliensis]